MQKGVLIKDGNKVIEKRVYSGDISDLESKLNAEGVSYEIFADNAPEFSDQTVEEVQTKEQLLWKSLKDVNSKISFLAQKFGLE